MDESFFTRRFLTVDGGLAPLPFAEPG